MIREVAILNVRAGQANAFETAMAEALYLIRSTPGFQRITVERCMETASRYLLNVEWADLESHTVGFRESDRFPEWKAALHHFYDPFPVVEHYEYCIEAAGPA